MIQRSHPGGDKEYCRWKKLHEQRHGGGNLNEQRLIETCLVQTELTEKPAEIRREELSGAPSVGDPEG